MAVKKSRPRRRDDFWTESTRTISDIQDAVDHYWSTYVDKASGVACFDASLELLPLSDILRWTDYSSYGEFELGELANLPVADAKYELMRFRGDEWGSRALQWLTHYSIPPIVIVDGKAAKVVGDGWGRINLAVAFAVPIIDVIILKERRKGALCFAFERYGLKR